MPHSSLPNIEEQLLNLARAIEQNRQTQGEIELSMERRSAEMLKMRAEIARVQTITEGLKVEDKVVMQEDSELEDKLEQLLEEGRQLEELELEVAAEREAENESL